jgi:hypothetical protein
MLAFMLDLRFKGLKCVIDFFGHDKAKLLAIKYDNKILIPLIVKCMLRIQAQLVRFH